MASSAQIPIPGAKSPRNSFSTSSRSKNPSKQFYDAVKEGNLPLVQSLSLDPEVDLNRQDFLGYSPFYSACDKGHVDIVCYLLDFNERPIKYNLVNGSGENAFLTACAHGNERVVEMLLGDERIDVNRASNYQETPLWWASYNGHVGIVKLLLAFRGSRLLEVDLLKRDAENEKTAAEIAQNPVESEWEREGAFLERVERCLSVAELFQAFEKNPMKVRADLRKELWEPPAGELFALVVYLSDGYLKIHQSLNDSFSARRTKARKFFSLAIQLPMDLQMVLCNWVFGLGDSIIKRIHSEEGFKKFANEEFS